MENRVRGLDRGDHGTVAGPSYNHISHLRHGGKPMKCIKSKFSKNIRRVANATAENLVNSGKWEYCSKDEWKERDPDYPARRKAQKFADGKLYQKRQKKK